jgi:hypothetical protein
LRSNEDRVDFLFDVAVSDFRRFLHLTLTLKDAHMSVTAGRHHVFLAVHAHEAGECPHWATVSHQLPDYSEIHSTVKWHDMAFLSGNIDKVLWFKDGRDDFTEELLLFFIFWNFNWG